MTRRGPILGSLNNDINVTPLVDVCLVLLIIFMLVTPYLTPGRPVQMPTALNPDVEKEREGVSTITLQADGLVYLEAAPVSLEQLEQDLGGALKRGEVPIRVKADRRLAFGEVKKVLATAQRAGSHELQLLVAHVDEKGRPVSGGAAEMKGGGP